MNSSLTHLSYLGIIEITGSDASEFLQGQFTSDISGINNHQSRFSAWCNAQGRLICTFLILRDEDRYLLLLPDALVETVSKRLQMFVLRARVGITVLSEQYFCAGVSGNNAIDIADKLINMSTPGETVLQASLVVTGPVRTILLVAPDSLESYQSRLTRAGLHLSDHHLWQLADIQAGIAWIYPQTSGELLPQELNLEGIGALSYNKGCYPGQEIIARLHFRGRVKRRLCQGYAVSSGPLEIGTKLHSTETRAVGIIINQVRESEERVGVLAVIDIDQAGTNPVVTESGETLHFTPFPYQTDVS